jgi:hypothetical protein
MARRVPKPLVPVLVALAGAGIAIGAALPSFAGPNITPPADGAPQPVPSATSTAATPPAAQPTSTPSATPPEAALQQTGEQGPKDCSNCGVPPV